MARLVIRPGAAIQPVLSGHLRALIDLAKAEVKAEDGDIIPDAKIISSDGRIDVQVAIMSDGRVVVDWDTIF